MTADQFREIRVGLGFSQSDLAPLIGQHGKFAHQSVSAYETGKRAIPPNIAQLMRCYALLGAASIPQKGE